MESSNKKATSRTWATIVYQESAKENWQTELENLKIPCYISPLHDKDVEEEGEESVKSEEYENDKEQNEEYENEKNFKKPHWHILLIFSGQKSRNIVKKITEQVGGVGTELVQDRLAYIKYLCHLNNPDKYQYNVEDVISLNVTNSYKDVVEKADSDRIYKIINEMIEWNKLHDNIYFCDLVEYARKERPEWFRILVDRNNSLIMEYLRSKGFKKRNLDCNIL